VLFTSATARSCRTRAGPSSSLPKGWQAPVVTTLLGKGARCLRISPLHLGMLGMHGTAYANKAVADCDLIMAIGARWDDRITGKLSEFCRTRSRFTWTWTGPNSARS